MTGRATNISVPVPTRFISNGCTCVTLLKTTSLGIFAQTKMSDSGSSLVKTADMLSGIYDMLAALSRSQEARFKSLEEEVKALKYQVMRLKEERRAERKEKRKDVPVSSSQSDRETGPNKRSTPQAILTLSSTTAARDPVKSAGAIPNSSAASPSVRPSVPGPSTKPIVQGPSTKPSVPTPSAKPSVLGPSAKPNALGPSAKSSVPSPDAKLSNTNASARSSVPSPYAGPSVPSLSAGPSVPSPSAKSSVPSPSADPSVPSLSARPSVLGSSARTSTGDSQVPPVYEMWKLTHLRTFQRVWEEYAEGLDGGPAIRALEEAWGSAWRRSSSNQWNFRNRSKVYDLIREKAADWHVSCAEAAERIDSRYFPSVQYVLDHRYLL